MDPYNLAVWWIAGKLGLSPGALAIVLGAVIVICNLIAKKIPDTATGWLGKVRTVAGWIGLHIRNNTGTPPIELTKGVVIPTAPETSQRQAPAVTIGELSDAVAEQGPQGVTDVFQKAAAATKQGDVE